MNPLRVDKATHDEANRLYAGLEPVPVYVEFDAGYDHDAIERELDEQMGLGPKPPKWKPVGPALTCGHWNISRSTSAGLTDVICLTCGHEFLEVES